MRPTVFFSPHALAAFFNRAARREAFPVFAPLRPHHRSLTRRLKRFSLPAAGGEDNAPGHALRARDVAGGNRRRCRRRIHHLETTFFSSSSTSGDSGIGSGALATRDTAVDNARALPSTPEKSTTTTTTTTSPEPPRSSSSRARRLLPSPPSPPAKPRLSKSATLSAGSGLNNPPTSASFSRSRLAALLRSKFGRWADEKKLDRVARLSLRNRRQSLAVRVRSFSARLACQTTCLAP